MKTSLNRLPTKSSSSSIWFVQPREVWCVRNEAMGSSLILGENGFEDEDE
jgi:hypothetical protein